MMKKRKIILRQTLILSIVLMGMNILRAQTAQEGAVGINTETPQVTLDITGAPADASRMDGFIAPRLTGAQLRAKTYTAAQDGAMVYVTAADPAPAGQTTDVTHKGYYYFDIAENGGAGKWLSLRCCDGGSSAPTITALSCGSAVFSPNAATVGAAYSGTLSLPYTGGNAEAYSAGSAISSTGNTAFTASLQAGTLANGAGNLVYTVTGTPSTADNALFSISFGGQSCSNLSLTVNAAADACGNTPTATTVTDVDGNIYETVSIGTQTWLKSDLRTTKYNDGTPITNITVGVTWANSTTAAYCWYNNDEAANKCTYGALYNWHAVDAGSNGNKNICPTGWHVPTDAEWTALETYLGSDAGSKLAGYANLWTDGVLETNANFNTSGFTAVPGGFRSIGGGPFGNLGDYGYWWSSTDTGSRRAWRRYLYYSSSSVFRNSSDKSYGFSVRCLKDN